MAVDDGDAPAVEGDRRRLLGAAREPGGGARVFMQVNQAPGGFAICCHVGRSFLTTTVGGGVRVVVAERGAQCTRAVGRRQRAQCACALSGCCCSCCVAAVVLVVMTLWMQRRVGKMLLGKLSLHVDVAAGGLQAFEVCGWMARWLAVS